MVSFDEQKLLMSLDLLSESLELFEYSWRRCYPKCVIALAPSVSLKSLLERPTEGETPGVGPSNLHFYKPSRWCWSLQVSSTSLGNLFYPDVIKSCFSVFFQIRDRLTFHTSVCNPPGIDFFLCPVWGKVLISLFSIWVTSGPRPSIEKPILPHGPVIHRCWRCHFLRSVGLFLVSRLCSTDEFVTSDNS